VLFNSVTDFFSNLISSAMYLFVTWGWGWGGGGRESKKKETNAKFCSHDVRDAGKLGLRRAEKLGGRNEKEVNQIS
jgi:hypothetical protein